MVVQPNMEFFETLASVGLAQARPNKEKQEI